VSAAAAVPAVLLVGGLGTRLRPVLAGTPKPLAPMGDRAFLELLIRQLESQGIRRVVMCTGFLSEQIQRHFGDGGRWGVTIQYSREEHPLGTGGALKYAAPYLLDAIEFLVMNGDSFLEIDLNQLIAFHRQHGAMATIAVRKVDNAGQYGTVTMDGDCVSGFREKAGIRVSGLVNAGVYVFDHTLLDALPDGASSLERDVFPRILESGVYGLEQSGVFIDIGTPEDYARARAIGQELDRAAKRDWKFAATSLEGSAGNAPQ
jgi:NDP-sugar pyrophosphorylase family protein